MREMAQLQQDSLSQGRAGNPPVRPGAMARYRSLQRAGGTRPRGIEMPGLRVGFYLLVYVLTLLGGVDLFALAITAPMFVAILASLALTPRDRIGYVDTLAVVYFISFVVVPLQTISDYSFVGGEFNHAVPYPRSYFFLVATLALLSYGLLVAFLRPRRELAPPQPRMVAIPSLWIVLTGPALVLLALALAGSLDNMFAARYDRVRGDLDVLNPVIVALLSINATFAVIRRDTGPFAKLAVAGFACLCLLVVANPLNLARFVLLGAWIPVIFCALPSLLRPQRFYLAVPAIVLVVLPVLNITTRFGSERSDLLGEVFRGQNSVFKIAYFNLFELGCEAVRFVERYGHEFGSVFVSTVLTYVPREWWPGKPLSSGLLIGYMNVDEGGGNEYLAVPWFMDGYMDFGIAGSIAYSLALAAGFVLARKIFAQRVEGFDLYFLVFLANIAILIRGSLAVVMLLFLFQLVFLYAYTRAFTRPPASAPNRAAWRRKRRAATQS